MISKNDATAIAVVICMVFFVLVILSYFICPSFWCGDGSETTCSNFKTSIRTMCKAKTEFECTDHPTIKPGQLGHNPEEAEPLKQCILNPPSFSNDDSKRCITNEIDPLWDWTDNDKGYCPAG